MTQRILILSSNPKGTSTLNLEIEKRTIRESLKDSEFVIETREAVRPEDLQEALLKVKPKIVHFCGHGEGADGIVLMNDRGEINFASTGALKNLFKMFSDRIECIVLNACYSEVQANAIVEHINYVVGMNRSILDEAAILFARGFYAALGTDRSITKAYSMGKVAIQFEYPDDEAIREAISRKLIPIDDKNLVLPTPEYLVPVLKTNPHPKKIKPLWLSPEKEREAVRQLLAAIAGSYNTIKLFHTLEPIILKEQYIPIQVTLERRYKHTIETTWGYAESEAELRRIYALKGSGEEEIKRQQVDWQEAKRQESRIVVLADPGMGKSTLLGMEVCTTVEQSCQALDRGQPLEAIAIPLYIKLSRLADEIRKMPPAEAILKIIQERHSHLLKHNQNADIQAFLNAFLEEQLFGGKCLLLLDALDEVPQDKRHQLLARLNEFASDYKKCPIVGTSRIVGYGGKLINGAKDMEIVPFTQQQTEQYIETWFTNAQNQDYLFHDYYEPRIFI